MNNSIIAKPVIKLKPRSTDAVLGGQNTVPIGTAVVGGIAGAKNALNAPKRQLTSSKGATVATPLTDLHALNICSTLRDKFPRDLAEKAKQGPLTESQLVWVHKLAIEHLEKKLEIKQEVGGKVLNEIFRMLSLGGEKLKLPTIRLVDPNEIGEIKLYKAGPRSKYPGSIQVKIDNIWVGRIEELPLIDSAQFVKSFGCPNWVEKALLHFASDPVKVAAEYGKLTGCCCFCGRGLDDERSTAAGYGPVCAKHYGLPWKEIK